MNINDTATGPYASSTEAKKNGWFSRRHQTDEAHQAAKDSRRAHAAAKQLLADEQAARTLAKS
jgi:hypothetical protein